MAFQLVLVIGLKSFTKKNLYYTSPWGLYANFFHSIQMLDEGWKLVQVESS